MKKYIWVVVVIVVLILGAFVLSNNSPTPVGEKQTVKIGFSLPLTGDLAVLGESAKLAAELAKDNFGATKYNYEFIFEDDAFSPTKAASTVNKLIGLDKVNYIISFGSPAGNVIAPVAEKNKVIHFNVLASDPNVAKGDYNFIHWTPPYEEARVMVVELEKKNLTKVVLFGTNQPGVIAVANAFKKAALGSKVTVISEQIFNGGEKDMRSYINKATLAKGDVFLILASSPELEVLTKQIKELGVKTPVTSIESFEFSNDTSLFNGLWYVGPATADEKFAQLFAKTGKNPLFGSANMYDVINMIITATEKGNGKTIPAPEVLLSQINNLKDFKGALGILNFDNDGIVLSKAIVKIMKEGKPIILPN